MFTKGATNQPLSLIPIVQSDTTTYDPPLLGIIVLTADVAGDSLVVMRPDGTIVTLALPGLAAGAGYPCIIPGAIRAVMAATTFADAELVGLQ